MPLWCGNAAMAAWKSRTRCGNTSSLGKTKCTATIRPKICRVTKVFPELDAWTDLFARFVEAKGKVEPNKYRAFGYHPPGHLLHDVKLAWRDIHAAVAQITMAWDIQAVNAGRIQFGLPSLDPRL